MFERNLSLNWISDNFLGTALPQMTFMKVRDWIRELQQHGPDNIVIAIAGNKFDMSDLREVETRTAMDYAQDIGAVFTETSAKTAANVKELFVDISKFLIFFLLLYWYGQTKLLGHSTM